MKKHEPMTEERLAAIKARAEAATPGPWRVGYDGDVLSAKGRCVVSSIHDDEDRMPREHDAAFIAAAREDVTALLTEVERLRAREEWLAGQVAAHSEHYGETPFCIMPSEYKCKWNNIDFCQASVKKTR